MSVRDLIARSPGLTLPCDTLPAQDSPPGLHAPFKTLPCVFPLSLCRLSASTIHSSAVVPRARDYLLASANCFIVRSLLVPVFSRNTGYVNHFLLHPPQPNLAVLAYESPREGRSKSDALARWRPYLLPNLPISILRGCLSTLSRSNTTCLHIIGAAIH